MAQYFNGLVKVHELTVFLPAAKHARFSSMDMHVAPQNQHVVEVDNPADIERSKPSKSRYLFLLGFFCYFIFAWAGCYNLYTHRFKQNKGIKVPENTLYDPKYK